MSFSVVVVLHDSAAELRALLASIDAHLPARPQLIVVDSGSTDDGAARARAPRAPKPSCSTATPASARRTTPAWPWPATTSPCC